MWREIWKILKNLLETKQDPTLDYTSVTLPLTMDKPDPSFFLHAYTL